jgi:hypothetical protein
MASTPWRLVCAVPVSSTGLPPGVGTACSRSSWVCEYPAYQLDGTWTQDGQTKIVAPKTVVVPGSDGLYVVQLNADGLENQAEIVCAATDLIDKQTKITP